jgi:hypothetical protein
LSGGEIGFVSDECNDHVLRARTAQVFVPLANRAQGCVVRDIEDDQTNCRIPVVLGTDRAVGLLARCVPNVKIKCPIAEVDLCITEAGTDGRTRVGWNEKRKILEKPPLI